MRVAFAAWNDRIAPVFDVSSRVRLCDIEGGKVVREVTKTLAGELPEARAAGISDLGVQALVCGAISRLLHDRIVLRGIRVVPFVTGDLREVIRAWTDGRFDAAVFAMPGCRRRGRGWAAQAGRFPVNDDVRDGRGRGSGRAAGLQDRCVCPVCGRSVPHERGTPCVERRCMHCGSVLRRM